MTMVLDASVAVAAARSNEPDHAASKRLVERILLGEATATVPSIFSIEVAAALARRGVESAAVVEYVTALDEVLAPVLTIGPRTAARIREVAIAARIRAADAVYVWLAARRGLPLCTLDRELATRAAAHCLIIVP